jgi:alpha-galactosidase
MMLPEQAANWAYPQPEMSLEEASFCLITGLLGRYYLSGYLNKMSDQSRALVAEAVATAKTVRGEITRGVPSWPLGLPGWNDDWVSLALGTETSALVSLWSRRATERVVKLDFPQFVGREISISTVFPLHLEPWATTWDSGTGSLTVRAGAEPLSARTLRLEVITR